MKIFSLSTACILAMASPAFATGHGNIWLEPTDYQMTCNENGAKITLNSNGRDIYLGKSCDSAIPEAGWTGGWFLLDTGDFIVDAPGLIQFRGPLQCALPKC